MDKARPTGKNLVVLLRRPPLGTTKGAEGLRMALGQSMAQRVTVVLVDAGVWLAGPMSPELVGGEPIGKHLGMLIRIKQRVWVEAESLEREGLDHEQLAAGVEVVSHREIEQALIAADAVVVY